MRTHAELCSLLLNPGVIAVIRADKAEDVLPICEALVAGGVIALEITLTTPNALAAITQVNRHFGARALTGVGTVLNAQAAREAIEAGAEFVVSPITRPEIAQVSRALGKPVMLGAYTPTEAQTAHEAGADFIKVFPADGLGPGYIKSLRAPLPHLRVVPTGGVDLQTATAFLQAGCVALGVGSSLVSPRLIKEGNWAEMTRVARALVTVVTDYRKKQ